MSLKAFHIFFITISSLFCLGFGAWGVRDYFESGTLLHLGLGVGAFIAGVGLVVYGAWFLRKLKDVSFR